MNEDYKKLLNLIFDLGFIVFCVDSWNLGGSCSEIHCDFGADCEEDGSRAGCICNIQCPDLTENEVRENTRKCLLTILLSFLF